MEPGRKGREYRSHAVATSLPQRCLNGARPQRPGIRAAWEIADKRNLRKPVVEQPQYNLIHRARVEVEYARLYEDLGLGLTTWSPLASGILTGKYVDGIPEGSRASLSGYGFITEQASDAALIEKVRAFVAIAREVETSPAKLALAWTASNPKVSSVILGASSVAQLEENLGALEVLDRLTPELCARIEGVFA